MTRVRPLPLEVAAADVWDACDAHPDDRAALVSVTAPALTTVAGERYPMFDEPHVATWAGYVADAARDGAAAVLRRQLPQLRFPIAAGVADDPRYVAATRLGAAIDGDGFPPFDDPAGITIALSATAAGHLPVIVARHRRDFERLLQALSARNAPVPVSPSCGACAIEGLVNVDRVRAGIAPTDPRSRDRLVLLGAAPYANVPGSELGLSEATWRERSIVLRREHAGAHYLLKRVFGITTHGLHDELAADYAGIVAAARGYRPDWGRRLLGIDERGVASARGRIWRHRGEPALGVRAMHALAVLTARAIDALASLDRHRAADRDDEVRLRPMTAALVAIARTPLVALGSLSGATMLRRAYREAYRAYRLPMA